MLEQLTCEGVRDPGVVQKDEYLLFPFAPAPSCASPYFPILQVAPPFRLPSLGSPPPRLPSHTYLPFPHRPMALRAQLPSPITRRRPHSSSRLLMIILQLRASITIIFLRVLTSPFHLFSSLGAQLPSPITPLCPHPCSLLVFSLARSATALPITPHLIFTCLLTLL